MSDDPAVQKQTAEEVAAAAEKQARIDRIVGGLQLSFFLGVSAVCSPIQVPAAGART